MRSIRLLLAGAASLLLAPTPASSHTGHFLSEYGTATVDGVIQPGEYECLSDQFQAGQITYNFRFCHTNDENNDYYAFEVDDKTDSFFDLFVIMFDDEHDGTLAESSSIACPNGEPLEDAIGYFHDTPRDLVYCRVGLTLLVPGSSGDFVNHVSGVRTFTPGVGATIELAHPLSSGDSDDYSLSIGNRVGFCMYYQDGDNPNSGVGVPSITLPNSCWFSLASTGLQNVFGDVRKIDQTIEMIEKLGQLAQDWVRVRFPDFPHPPCLRCPPNLIHRLSRTQELVLEAIALPVNAKRRLVRLDQAAGQMRGFGNFVVRRRRHVDAALGEGAAAAMVGQVESILRDIQQIVEPIGPGEVPPAVPGDGRGDGGIIAPGPG